MRSRKLETSKGTILIRGAQESDATAFRDLRLEGLKLHPDAFGAAYERDAAQPLEFWQERIRTYADPRRGTIQFAVAGESLAGVTGIYRDDGAKTRHNTHIWGVYVRPDWRGAGIADALIEACVGWAEAEQVSIVKLGVATNNPGAIRCYLRCGFSIYGVEPDALRVDGVSIDEFLMARRIKKGLSDED